MISQLRGTVVRATLDHAVVDVGGVGFAVQCVPATLAGLTEGQEATLQTALVVREDALTLYGFGSGDERDMFHLLQTVTGVGPRLALGILAVLNPEELRHAVKDEDLARLKLIPGIGHKSAQRLVLELAGKIGEPATSAGGVTLMADPGGDPEVVAALVQLGWTPKDAAAAVDAVSGEHAGKAEVLRAALQYLGARRG